MLIKKIVSFLFYIFIIFILLLNSEFSLMVVRQALYLCYEKIIPSLFIFMTLSSFISQSDALYIFSYFFQGLLKLLKINSKKAACYVFLSLISGFVVGAKFLNSLYNEGYDKPILNTLSILMCTNSLPFIILVVGVLVLNNFKLALILFTSLFLASFITAFLYSFTYNKPVKNYNKNIIITKTPFSLIIKENVISMLSICAIIIIFYTFSMFINHFLEIKILKTILISIMEVSSAVVINGEKGVFILCIVLSIFPLSTLSQISFFAKEAVDIKFLLYTRIIHTPLSLLILRVLVNLFPVATNVYSNSDVLVKNYYNSIDISITFFILSILFITFLETNNKFGKINKV